MNTLGSKTTTLADFRPLRAWRYDLARVQPSDVIAPPYDVISAAGQENLYARHPHNCIRLILNKILESDTEKDNRYTRARDLFRQWREEKVLIQDAKPRYYLYRQDFLDPRSGRSLVRRALLGALKLEPFEKGVVIPHEKTLAKARADRKSLIEATGTNFSPIFALYEDPQKEIETLLPALEKGDPFFDALDEDKVHHRLWAVEGETDCTKIHKSLASQPVYIADGHHRYTISVEYARQQREKAGNPDQELASDFVYMALVGFRDSGLALFPTHRLITGVKGYETEKTLEALQKFFTVEKMAPEKLMPKMESLSSRDSVIGFVPSADQGYLLTLKDEKAAREHLPAGKPDICYRLDVNICAYLIFKSILGLSETDWETCLAFTHSDPEALEAVRSGKVQAAFLLKPPPVQVLGDMGKVRELMPQKSTYFYPKLASGLLFYQHDDKAIPAVSGLR